MSESNKNENLLNTHGAFMAIVGVGALVTAGRMRRLHISGKGAMESIESVITGMIIYGILEQVKKTGKA